MMERPKDTRKQHEASSLELSFEKASDGDVFKDSLNSEDCILILERCTENIKKKMEELCITTKNTKESQIKGELQLVSMNERINFISEKFNEFEKDIHEKDDIIKNLSKKTVWNGSKGWRIREISRPTRTIFTNSRRICISVHWIAERNKNMDDLLLKQWIKN